MKCVPGLALVALLSIALPGCAAQAVQSPVGVTAIRTGSVHGIAPVRSWRELRDQNVIRQRFDYSCGAAALATLMKYYFGEDVSEAAILVSILGSMSEEDVRDREANGLSLLDLRDQARRMGYQAVGVRLTYPSLPTLTGPIIVHLEHDDYRHFAVLKGVRGDRVYLADPSLGNTRLSVDRFAQRWSGVALVLGKQGFGLPQEHPLAVETEPLPPGEDVAARRSLFAQ